MKKIVTLLILNLFFFISCSNRKLKDLSTTVIDIRVNSFYSENIVGKKGTIVLRTEWPSPLDIEDTQKKTCFETTISNTENKSYTVKCGLWRQKDGYLLIFCNDLYSDKQTLNLDEGKESYDLKFKIVSYNQEKIIINWAIVLEDCKQQNDELICPIKKSQLEAILDLEYLYLVVNYINSKYRIEDFVLIPKIDIVYNSVQKKDINVVLTKLIENVGEHDTHIAYQTNINDIQNIYMNTESFELPFESKSEEANFSCGFRKYENNPLLLVCFVGPTGEFWLKEITKDIKIENKDIKYNFIIKPVKITDKIYIDRNLSGSFIFLLTPEVFDFTKKDSFTIEYFIENPDSLTGITFNENQQDLVCEEVGRQGKRCIVPKSHFTGKSTGYYFTKHQNHLNRKSFLYEAPPIKVILPDSDSDSNLKGNDISISYFISLLLFLIML